MPNALHDAGLMTTAEVARFLGVHPERVRQHTRAGDIAAVGQVARSALYRMEDAEALLALRAERGYRVPPVYEAGEVVDGDGPWPPLVVAAS